jgi:hypothetical protein
MLEQANTVTVIVLTVVSIAFLFGIGAFVGSFVGRRYGQSAVLPTQPTERRAPERLVRELERCVELGDCVTRDADSLSTIAAAQTPPIPRELACAILQLIKTTKSLAGRLQRMGEVGGLSRRNPSASSGISYAQTTEPPKPVPTARPVAPAMPAQSTTGAAAPELSDARRFPRSQFRGSAKATIYPLSSSAESDPIQCTVLTRNLSCGGIGIAHCERLLPQQIIVLEAVGKVLVGEIRWCRQVEDRFFVAGCRLVKASD